jgi:hypothetical protein
MGYFLDNQPAAPVANHRSLSSLLTGGNFQLCRSAGDCMARAQRVAVTAVTA